MALSRAQEGPLESYTLVSRGSACGHTGRTDSVRTELSAVGTGVLFCFPAQSFTWARLRGFGASIVSFVIIGKW